MRIGIYGGTFCPPHNGHLTLAISAREQLELDQVIWVPAGDPVGKTPELDGNTRLALTHAACTGMDTFHPSPIEIKRPGKSYTIDTLQHYHAARPDAELFLIVGADQAMYMNTWKNLDGIMNLATIAYAFRKGFPVDPHRAIRMTNFVMPRLDISSTDIRARVRAGKTVHHLVPPLVNQQLRMIYRDSYT